MLFEWKRIIHCRRSIHCVGGTRAYYHACLGSVTTYIIGGCYPAVTSHSEQDVGESRHCCFVINS